MLNNAVFAALTAVGFAAQVLCAAVCAANMLIVFSSAEYGFLRLSGFVQRAGLGEEWELVFRQPTTEVE